MDVWSTYESRAEVHGQTQREVSYIRETRALQRKTKDSLSFQRVTIDNSYEQEVSVINSDNFNEKTIIALPNEDLCLGSLIHWMNNYWLITERDANATVNVKCKMVQCNHLLRWVSKDGVIHEQWSIVEDGTKYLSGELEDRNFVVTRGDSRIAITIPRNEDTVKLDREIRFLVDDPDAPHKLAYTLSKPLKTGLSYNGSGVDFVNSATHPDMAYKPQGVFKFVMQEVTATKDDNHELGIADYYKYYDKDGNRLDSVQPDDDVDDTSKGTSTSKEAWL